MKPATRNDLTPEESQRRAEIEPQIKRNIKNCIETGALLREMSDRRLYRNTHSTFKEYVEEVYGIAVRTAYELVDHADVIGSLPDECANFAQTATPSQTRALKKVPAEKRANVIKDAKAKADSEGKDLTASHIKDAADTEVMPDQETPEQNTANRDGSCADTQARPAPFDPHKNAFAAQVEEITNDLLATGTAEQMSAFILACEVSIRKAKAEMRRLLVETP